MESIAFQHFWESLTLYNHIYQYGTLFLMIIFSLYLMFTRNLSQIGRNHVFIFLLLFAVILLFGTWPYEFAADRLRYVDALSKGPAAFEEDTLWKYYTLFCGLFLRPFPFLVLTASIYVLGFYLYAKKTHSSLSIIMMMGFLSFLFFKAYAVNTMRAGFAGSIMFYALTWRSRNHWIYWGLLLASVSAHFSMILPAASLLIAQYFPRTRYFFAMWMLSIPLSYLAGSYFQVIFEPYLADYSEKATGYLLSEDERYNTGFRIDFIFYSVLPVLLAYYYIFKREIKDTFYLNIFNTYMIANSFWILVIRANFSDRMAYLSWIFIPILLLYPPLKYKIWRQQNVKIAYILMAQELFTFALAIR